MTRATKPPGKASSPQVHLASVYEVLERHVEACGNQTHDSASVRRKTNAVKETKGGMRLYNKRTYGQKNDLEESKTHHLLPLEFKACCCGNAVNGNILRELAHAYSTVIAPSLQV
jgi:hypothetical protein